MNSKNQNGALRKMKLLQWKSSSVERVELKAWKTKAATCSHIRIKIKKFL